MPREKQSKTRKIINQTMREVHKEPPARVAKTLRTQGKAAAERQMRAIGLSKARAAGARIPKRP